MIAAILSAAVIAGAPAAAAEQAVATHCSASGDVCYGVFNRAGRVYLRISTAARYFKRYTLCVRLLPPRPGPENALRCGSFRSSARAARRGARP
jgi:hypothetical protein